MPRITVIRAISCGQNARLLRQPCDLLCMSKAVYSHAILPLRRRLNLTPQSLQYDHLNCMALSGHESIPSDNDHTQIRRSTGKLSHRKGRAHVLCTRIAPIEQMLGGDTKTISSVADTVTLVKESQRGSSYLTS